MEENHSEQNTKVPVNTLVKFMLEALTIMGTSHEDAEIIADVIITTDLWGVRSHGIAHLKMYHERIKKGLQLPTTRITLVMDTPTTAVLDGGNGNGMVIGHHAMKMAIDKARQYGLGAVAVRNSSHYGMAGYDPLMAVKEGMVRLNLINVIFTLSISYFFHAHSWGLHGFGTMPSGWANWLDNISLF